MKLRTHFVVLVGATLVPAVILAVALVLLVQHQQRVTVENGLQQTARALAVAVDREFESSIRALEVLGTSEALDVGDRRALYEHARRARDTNPRWLTVFLIDASGNHLLSLLRPFGAPLPRPEPYDDIQAVARTGKPRVSDLAFGPLSQRHIIVILVPVAREGRVGYVLGVSIATESLSDLLAGPARSADSVVSIRDRKNALVARSRDLQPYVGGGPGPERLESIQAARQTGKGVFESPDLDGRRVYTAVSRVGTSDFIVLVSVPVATVAKDMQTPLWLLSVGGVAVLAIALGVSMLLARRVAAPIAELSNAAVHLASGEPIPDAPASPVAEVTMVRHAMARAAEALRERTAERERRIAAEAARAEAEERAAALRRSERRFRELADAMPQIVWASRPDGYLDYFNRKWHELTGASEGEGGDQDWLPVVHPDDRERCLDAWHEAVRTGNPFQVEYRLAFARTGEHRWHLGRALPVRDESGGIIRWYGTCTDIHDLRVAQEAVAVARRSAERAKAAAEEASRAKDHFLAALSHELRTPLSPVLAGISLLQKDQTLPERARDHLEVVRRNVELEALLIDDLLDVTRIAGGKVELEQRPVDLCTIIDRAVEVCRPDIDARRLHFGVDLGTAHPYIVEADAARLQQVFWNLLKNAIKFTPHGGRVGLHCRPEGDAVVVEVVDSGIGIEPAALGRIFDAFGQGERAITQRFGGLGLGLTISKTLVERHGGRIEAESEGRDRGATFRVRLPMVSAGTSAAVENPARPSDRPERGGLRPLRILLVEDHDDTAEMIASMLELEGHHVQAAGDVATALEIGTRETFDLLVSDLGLPDRSGLDLMRELRVRGTHLRGIALSGYGQESDIQQSRAAGFEAHLVKPVDLEHLAEAIERVARRAAAA